MKEKIIRPVSGYLGLLVWLVLVVATIYLGFVGEIVWTVTVGVLALVMMAGFFYINQNGTRVIKLFCD